MSQLLTLDRSSRMVVSRMEHVHVAVADLERSIDWYQRAFGFSVRWTDGTTAHVGTDRFYVITRSRRTPPMELDNELPVPPEVVAEMSLYLRAISVCDGSEAHPCPAPAAT